MISNTETPFGYVRQHYGVPACFRRRVVVDGKPGIITEDRGQYIGVNFDSDKPGSVTICHPTWQVEYGEIGAIRKQTRSQARYQRYLEAAECFDSFIDFCYYDQERKAR